MIKDMFVPKGTGRKLEWRPRSALPDDCARFGPAEDGFDLFVVAEMVAAMRQRTTRAKPKESFGVLVGQHYEDAQGVYTVVSGVEYSDNADASAGHVRVSAEEMSHLKSRAIAANPASSLVGWTHSHDTMAQYSHTDIDEQRTWRHDYQVGILTLMSGPQWGVAYRGPDARPLGFAMPSIIHQARPGAFKGEDFVGHRRMTDNGRAQTAPILANVNIRQPATVILPHTPVTSPHGKLVPAVLAATLAALVLALFWLSQINSSVDEVSGRLETLERASAAGVAAAPTDAWTCSPLTGAAPLSVTCEMSARGSRTGQWDFGDGSALQLSIVKHTFKEPGEYTVKFAAGDAPGTESGETTIKVLEQDADELGPRQRCLLGGGC